MSDASDGETQVVYKSRVFLSEDGESLAAFRGMIERTETSRSIFVDVDATITDHEGKRVDLGFWAMRDPSEHIGALVKLRDELNQLITAVGQVQPGADGPGVAAPAPVE